LPRKLRHRRPFCFAWPAYVLDQRAVVYHAAASGLLADNEIKERYCAV
jgi:hypothetical protein